ncbi:MAG: glutaredoxin family protein [Methanomicrobiales archaeon]|nr:glutaredoxin family protein [Methanomicrobiales archaeon]
MTIYTSPSCTNCQALKSYLKKNNLEYKEIDVSIDQDAFSKVVIKTKKMELPIIEYKDKYLAGFNINDIEKLYE